MSMCNLTLGLVALTYINGLLILRDENAGFAGFKGLCSLSARSLDNGSIDVLPYLRWR